MSTLEEHERTQSQEIEEQLLNELSDERQQRRIVATESMDFKRSSCRAWNLLRKLDPEGATEKLYERHISADDIAKQIKQRSMRNTNETFEKGVRREYQDILNVCSERNEVLSAPIREDEICTALKNMKTGKATGVDGVYLDMLRNLGARALRWMSLVFSKILSKVNFPDNEKGLLYRLSSNQENSQTYHLVIVR